MWLPNGWFELTLGFTFFFCRFKLLFCCSLKYLYYSFATSSNWLDWTNVFNLLWVCVWRFGFEGMTVEKGIDSPILVASIWNVCDGTNCSFTHVRSDDINLICIYCPVDGPGCCWFVACQLDVKQHPPPGRADDLLKLNSGFVDAITLTSEANCCLFSELYRHG